MFSGNELKKNENSNKSLIFLNNLVSSNRETCFIQEPEDLNHDTNKEVNVHEKNIEKMIMYLLYPYGQIFIGKKSLSLYNFYFFELY